MTCCGSRTKYDDLRPEQKWDFISLNDFKSTSCLEFFAYGYLWISLFISTAVYGVDTFTAVNLLAFDKFTGITPTIPLNISKWIISGCVIASWVNLAYEHFRALRVIRRGAVAESFMDSLAVRLQSIRMGSKGRGWRRFLVFSELAKSKKGAEYVAIFTYFSFQSWIRVIFCSGPRQVVNAMTLYSVLDDNLDPDATDAGQSLLQFFKNIGLLAEKDHQQAVILSGMLFTLVIWTFAALSLLLAVLFYILFLWHYIPNADGGLSGYCERKVNQKLTKIVSAKVNKALEDEERKKLKEARKAAGKQGKGEKPILGRQATLPMLLDSDNGDKLPQMPMLGRNDTMSTLPQYSSRPGTPSGQQPTLPGLELENLGQQRPYAPSRMGTKSSFSSVTSNAPLISNANEMGYGGRASPAPSLPQLDSQNGFPFPQRSMTASTSNTSFPRPGAGPPRGQTPLFRQQTQDGYYNASPSPFSDAQNARSQSPGPNRMDAYGRPIRGPTPRSAPAPYGVVEMPGSDNMGRNSPAPYPTSAAEMQGATPTLPFSSVEMPGSTPEPRIPDFAVEMAAPGSTPAPRFAELSSSSPGRSSPAPSQFNNSTGGRNSPILRMAMTASPAPMSAGGYQAFQPGPRSASAGPNGPPQGQQQRPSPGPQYRNMTEPMQRVGTPNGGPPGRVGTPQGGPMAPPRTGSGTYDPYNSNRQMSSGPGGGYRQ